MDENACGSARRHLPAGEVIIFTRDDVEYVRDVMSEAVENSAGFAAAYDQTDWSRYVGIAAFENNNRGNACIVSIST